MFSKKSLRVVITQIDDSGEKHPYEFLSYPMDVMINKVEDFAIESNVKIYGISEETAEMITAFMWYDFFMKEQTIDIYTDDGFGEKQIYSGQIVCAKPVYEQPNIYIDIKASAGTFQNTMGEIPPSSMKGEVSVPLFFDKMAKDYGCILENNGVSEQLVCKDPYFRQDGLSNRLYDASRALGLNYQLVGDNRIIISPKDVDSSKRRVWNITKEDYIGYPTFTDVGISLMFDSVFDVRLSDIIKISGSQVSIANGSWIVQQIVYNLSTKIGGKWFMKVNGGIYAQK